MQMVLGGVGAVIGGYFGGPAGAEAGFMIGSMIGSLLDPPKAPALPDLKLQTSAYGKFIPSVYGRYRVAGNVIWAGPATQQTVSKKKQPQQEAFIPLAVMLCAGPITNVTRIWANNKLVYDITDPSNFENLTGSNTQLSGFTLYYGDEEQVADPTMESYEGAGNVPAYRGLAYMVFSNLGLLNYGNAIPQLEFEVVSSPGTSWSGAVMSTYEYDTANGTSWSFANVGANGGYAYGVGYNSGYNGLIVASLSAYGANLQSIIPPPLVIPSASTLCGTCTGASDVPGLFDGKGWYDEGAFYTSFEGLEGVPTAVWNPGPCNEGCNFYRSGEDIWFATIYPNACDFIFHCATTGQMIAQGPAAPVAGSGWNVWGASADYLYAATYVTGTTPRLYQLDRETLALTGLSWAIPVGVYWQGAGSVLDDEHIYIAGASVYMFQQSTDTWTMLGASPMPENPTALRAVNSNFLAMASAGASINQIQFGFLADSGLGETVELSEIVSNVCLTTGLTAEQFDVTSLTDQVTGYCVSAYSSGRSAIDQLMSLYFFDAVDSEGKIKFVKRGGASAVTIPWDDLGAASTGGADSDDPIQEVVDDPTTLPRSLILTYKGSTNDYQAASQRAFRNTTESNYDASATVSVVLPDGEAATRAQSILWSSWMNRRSLMFGTTLKYFQYEPTDVVTVTDQDGTLYTVRLTTCDFDGKGALTWNAVIEGQTYPNLSQFVASGGQSIGVPKQTIGYSGPTVLAVIDTAPLRQQDTNPGVYLAACGAASNWPGITLEMSRDDNTFTQVGNLSSAAAIGTASTVLGSFSGGNQPDELNTVTVSLFSGTLASVNYATMMAGTNLALIGSEVVSFRNATLVSAGVYALSGFLRGVGGTENQMGTHYAGERFVFLDPTKLTYESLLQTDVGSTLYWEYQLANVFYQQPQPIASKQIVNGCVKPLSPALFTAGGLLESGSGPKDIVLNWFRRARVGAGWLDGTDVPLDENTESYTLSVINSAGVVKRQVTVTGPFNAPATATPVWQYQGTPTYTYTAAQIAADGFTTGQTISFSVYQNSNQGVPGWASTTSTVL
jgi:hypothetical protein